MVLSNKFKEISVEVICFLYILLFVYAAVNKLLDFENFQVQLAQSPLLSAFAGPISYTVIAVEVVIALMLCFQKSKKTGLYAGFSLMVMFTGYIVIMLNFSPFVPCSCGGILEDMSWTEHLVFNMVFVIIGGVAVYWFSRALYSRQTKRKIIGSLLASIVFPAAGLVAGFALSEDMMQKRNNFTRRFPHHPAEFIKDYKLSGQSYIAGSGNGRLYIADKSDPLKVLVLDKNLDSISTHNITTNEPNRRFKNLRISVKPPYFFVSDGYEAFVFKGKIADWKASIWIDQLAYYNTFVAIDSELAAIKAISAAEEENIIGLMRREEMSSVKFNKKLLDKQIDGFFDTDGKLMFNEKNRQLVYVYLYRNQYVLTDLSLKSKIVRKTIDTTSRARITVTYVDRIKAKKISSPMRVVNKTAATFDDFVYINSKLIGQFEPKDTWDFASIIDVYNIQNGNYLFSFYLYDKEDKKLSEFIIDVNRIYTIAGNTVSAYQIDSTACTKTN